METPEYFIDRNMSWRSWLCTKPNLAKTGLNAGLPPSGSVFYTNHKVDSKYPGFVRAHDVLTNIGCDGVFITDVLKFCILHADGVDLADFLVKSETLNKVETALAIGLSGEELTKLLTSTSLAVSSPELPDGLGDALVGMQHA